MTDPNKQAPQNELQLHVTPEDYHSIQDIALREHGLPMPDLGFDQAADVVDRFVQGDPENYAGHPSLAERRSDAETAPPAEIDQARLVLHVLKGQQGKRESQIAQSLVYDMRPPQE